MKSSNTLLTALAGRFVGCLLLVPTLPMLLFVAMLIHMAAESPVLVTDEYPNDRGDIIRRLRFRTTGRGTDVFRALGRFLRTYSIDEFPALWSVVRGDISLRELFSVRE